MSCYIVENGDIDVLVNAAIQYHLTTTEPHALGSMLLAENIDSYRHCYRHYTEPIDLDDLGSRHYTHTAFPLPLHPYAVLKVVDRYAVASDDHPRWFTSEARWLCVQLTGKAESFLSPDDLRMVEVGDQGWSTKAYKLSAQYERMPWGVTHVHDAFAFRWAA